MAAIPNVLRLRGCATGLIPCFCLPTEMSLRYLRLLAFMLLPSDFSVTFLPGMNQWLVPTIPVGCLSFRIEGVNTDLKDW